MKNFSNYVENGETVPEGGSPKRLLSETPIRLSPGTSMLKKRMCKKATLFIHM